MKSLRLCYKAAHKGAAKRKQRANASERAENEGGTKY